MTRGTSLFAALLCFVACTLGVDAQVVNVYRNDAMFNQFNLEDGLVVSHRVDAAGANVTITDAAGIATEMPLQAIDSCTVRTSDIPSIYITLTDYPDATQLWEKDLYLNATMKIDGRGYVDDQSDLSLTVKGRGNTTWYFPKKPMRLKFNKKTSISGFKKAKNYVLLANYLDPSLMKNALTLFAANRLGMSYTNHYVPCNLYINGSYAGAYLLTEKIGINSTSVDIDETKGILFELSTEYDETYKFRSVESDLPVMVKDPDFDELYAADASITPEERLAMWKADFSAAEHLAEIGRGSEAFDLADFVDYYLVCNFAGNHEIGYPKSVYIYKDSISDESLYHVGPIWDFDVAYNFNTKEDAVSSPEKSLWVNALFRSLMSDPAFETAYRERLTYFIDEVYPEVELFIDQYAALIEPSAKLNGLRWPDSSAISTWAYLKPSFDTKQQISLLKDWLSSRLAFLQQSLSD